MFAGLAIWGLEPAVDSSVWVGALVTGFAGVFAGGVGYLGAGRLLRLAELRHLRERGAAPHSHLVITRT